MTELDRKTLGNQVITKMFGGISAADNPATRDIARITNDYLFGEIWSRPGLALRDRSLITVATLLAAGHEPQLKTHMKGAISNGVTVDELKEVAIHLANYSGWPSAMNGLRILQEVAKEAGLEFADE